MEYRRGRPDQARARRRSDPQIAHALCAGRPAALRAGQMVSRRKPAALGVRTVLAQGRRADLEESRPDRDHREAAQGRYQGRRALRRRHRAKTRGRFRIRPAGVRRSLALAAEGSGAAAQCRSLRFQTVRSGRALAHGAGVRSGAERAQGICAADPALERRRQQVILALEERALETAPRQSVPDPRRFAAGLAAADRLAAAYSSRKNIPTSSSRIRWSRARSCRSTTARRRPKPRRIRRCRSSSSGAAACAPRCRSRSATAFCAPSCRRWRSWRIISNWSRRWRRPPKKCRCRSMSRAIRRRSIRASR